jgi:hypothetical protein
MILAELDHSTGAGGYEAVYVQLVFTFVMLPAHKKITTDLSPWLRTYYIMGFSPRSTIDSSTDFFLNRSS